MYLFAKLEKVLNFIVIVTFTEEEAVSVRVETFPASGMVLFITQ